MNSRRAESFSDGVFAVAITVLVFNLLPIGSHVPLTLKLLGGFWPSYFAYAVSFLTIGIMWVNHHGMLAQITRVDRPLLMLNLLLLLGVVALPFPTALVAGHLTAKPGGGQLAVVVYGLNMIAISVTFGATWVYLTRHAYQLGGSSHLQRQTRSTLRFTGGNLGYVAGTLIAAFASAVAGLVIFGLLGVYYVFEHLPSPAPGSDGTADDS
ncbi:MAG: TMEM175 family protein [Streptosporangiaceae bacterium]